MRWPVSVKGVVLDEDDGVLLGMNDRDEWELLGGRLEPGRVRGSQEHSHVRFHSQAGLSALALPAGYRLDIDLWRRQREAS
ncbi:hypothetical protein FM112_13590 [Gulosibacter sp. 10]|nr:hypothetical protein FM112_13590 [Gulosibacter sp. 10]